MDNEVRVEIERIRDEDNRQNHRLDSLEEQTKEFREIALSVQKLATNMEHMLEEIKDQGKRLKKIEEAPLQSLSLAKSTFVSTLVKMLAGALITVAVMLIASEIGGI